ncbi:hypothetical protein J7J74_01145 [bacterium]|nr:hypothetical protein [bacterium]
MIAPGRTGIERRISVKGIEKDIEYFLKRGIDKFAFFIPYLNYLATKEEKKNEERSNII